MSSTPISTQYLQELSVLVLVLGLYPWLPDVTAVLVSSTQSTVSRIKIRTDGF